MSVKLSIFLVQKIAFSLFWKNKPKFGNILIDTFLVTNKLFEKGYFEDRYFPGLADALNSKNYKYSYLFRIYGLGISPLKFIKTLNILKHDKTNNYIFEYQLVKYSDIPKIFFQIFLYPFQTLQLFGKNQLFNYHLIQDISKQDLLAFTRYFAGKNLAEENNIEKIISWSEFQLIERAFNFGYRTENGKGKILGTQFFLNYPNYLNTYVDKKDMIIGSAPHQVLVNGKYYLKDKPDFYALGVSLRYKSVFEFKKDSQKRENILLLASYLKNETKQMIDFCKNISNLQIKLHPTQMPQDFKIPENMELISGDLYQFFQTSNIVITTESGTAVEAVAVGVSVIIVNSQTNLTSNPLIDFGKGEIWDEVDNEKELLTKLNQLQEFRKNNPERIDEISKFYKDNFFVEPTEENILKVFELK